MADRYSNWELSSDRAHAARRVMLAARAPTATQVGAVRGFADKELRVPDDPLDARNRRVSIVCASPAAVDLERIRARASDVA